MHPEVLLFNALPAFKGKPVTISVDGKKRVIGEVTAATVAEDRSVLSVDLKLTDDEVAGILGASALRSKRNMETESVPE